MSIKGTFSDFSLPEVFQFLEQGQKTGLLKLREIPDDKSAHPLVHFVWFYQGRIVAAADRSDQRGLLKLLERRGWISERAAEKIFAMYSTPTPLGLCLKAHNLIHPEQLNQLFYGQVIRQVCDLFQLQSGQFIFDPQANLPMAEMTGLSQPAVEVTLTALRSLKDWRALTEKLPLADSALVSVTQGQPAMKLAAKEWQVWEFVNGNTPINTIAKQLRLPVDEVRRIAFRLIVVDLAEEVPVPFILPEVETEEFPFSGHDIFSPPQEITDKADKAPVSHSFLQSLVGFLKTKV